MLTQYGGHVDPSVYQRRTKLVQGGAVIGANAHTHSTLHKLYFYHKSVYFLLVYLSIYVALDLYIRVNENSLAYRHHILPLYTLYNI